jgi:hypothetical protein
VDSLVDPQVAPVHDGGVGQCLSRVGERFWLDPQPAAVGDPVVAQLAGASQLERLPLDDGIPVFGLWHQATAHDAVEQAAHGDRLFGLGDFVDGVIDVLPGDRLREVGSHCWRLKDRSGRGEPIRPDLPCIFADPQGESVRCMQGPWGTRSASR